MIEGWDLLLDLLPEYGLKIGVAVLCGVLLGSEREYKDKPAGLRTIVLITVGATVYMLVSDAITLTTKGPEAITQVDPSRIASQVVTGIGFLGAGTIIQARGAIHGLTTAATVWVAAGIGLCIGVGFPLLAIGITLLVLIVLVLLDPLSRWLSRRGEEREIDLLVANNVLTLKRIEGVLREHDLFVGQEQIGEAEDGNLLVRVRYLDNGASGQRFLDALARLEGVRGAPNA